MLRSRSRAAIAEPARPAPMTVTLSNMWAPVPGSGYRAPLAYCSDEGRGGRSAAVLRHPGRSIAPGGAVAGRAPHRRHPPHRAGQRPHGLQGAHRAVPRRDRPGRLHRSAWLRPQRPQYAGDLERRDVVVRPARPARANRRRASGRPRRRLRLLRRPAVCPALARGRLEARALEPQRARGHRADDRALRRARRREGRGVGARVLRAAERVEHRRLSPGLLHRHGAAGLRGAPDADADLEPRAGDPLDGDRDEDARPAAGSRLDRGADARARGVARPAVPAGVDRGGDRRPTGRLRRALSRGAPFRLPGRARVDGRAIAEFVA